MDYANLCVKIFSEDVAWVVCTSLQGHGVVGYVCDDGDDDGDPRTGANGAP